MEEEKKLAIIIPYRNREKHFKKFLDIMPDYLDKRNLNYRIFIIEQSDEGLFNQGKICNIAFDMLKEDYDYFCFHDVDILPEDGKADYSYPEIPARIGVYDEYNYRKMLPGFFGNIVIFNKKDFIKVNGYSNEYPGWGRFDDDLYYRCIFSNLKLCLRVSRFKHLPHEHPSHLNIENNTKRFDEMKTKKSDFKKEGLNTVKYEILGIEEFEKYTKINISN